ncbi:MAG: thiamine-phosphate kinase [Desulfofundulus sp.]|uniref:thiamine-phosphate kinase n=1 Tax=Desulfofundulus sp. TaxID=2282750 RepID=UPI003C715786
MKLGDLGEFGLINRLSRDLINRPGEVVRGIGDDAAILNLEGPWWLLFTTDMLVEGVHFSLDYATPAQVGIKSVSVNVSDIAAMGGWAAHGVVSLGLPARLSVEEVEELYRGIRQAAGEYGLNIVGGDTVLCPERLVINLALVGFVEKGRAVCRGGARVGDLIYVTGSLGKSAAGLYLCRHPDLTVDPGVAAFLKQAHLEPRARLRAGRVLSRAGVTAMDDVSDGLAAELREICLASGVGCRVRARDIPVDHRVVVVAALAACDPLDWAFSGGEDFELVFTVPPDTARNVEEMLAAAGEECRCIGEITPADKGVVLELPGGRCVPLEARGYDHFAP